jgi:pyrophosphatase PpaX
MLKAVIFDVDGVLVDSKNANVAFFQALLTKAGYPNTSKEDILACFHLPLWQSLEKLLNTKDEQEIKRVFEMAHDSSLRNSELLEFPEKLDEMLEELHKKYRLAIVTSRIKVGVDDIFSAKEIKHLFDVVVSFEDYENPKPHPEPLQVALSKLEVEAGEAIYIGDSKSDVEAAKAAGMKCVFLSPEDHEDATARIERLHELLEVLEDLDRTSV